MTCWRGNCDSFGYFPKPNQLKKQLGVIVVNRSVSESTTVVSAIWSEMFLILAVMMPSLNKERQKYGWPPSGASHPRGECDGTALGHLVVPLISLKLRRRFRLEPPTRQCYDPWVLLQFAWGRCGRAHLCGRLRLFVLSPWSTVDGILKPLSSTFVNDSVNPRRE
jgi:hypothetical protein